MPIFLFDERIVTNKIYKNRFIVIPLSRLSHKNSRKSVIDEISDESLKRRYRHG